jgi:hypothetical protein
MDRHTDMIRPGATCFKQVGVSTLVGRAHYMTKGDFRERPGAERTKFGKNTEKQALGR